MDEGELRAGALGGLWTALHVVASTGSTNTDLLALVGADPAAPEGQVLVAEEQSAGHGRFGRSWTSVPGASLTFSVLLRPVTVPAFRRGWLPLLTGVAVVSAVRSAVAGSVGDGAIGSGGGVDAVLKWPNDVLVGDRKLAGILAEQTPDGSAVVIGTGVNVATPADALPVSPAGLPATSLLSEGFPVRREPLLLEVLRQFERWYVAFRADPDPVRTGLLDAYRSHCATLGRQVRVELPVGRFMTGVARDIDLDGRLLVSDNPADPPMAISAGDVIHVRLPERAETTAGPYKPSGAAGPGTALADGKSPPAAATAPEGRQRDAVAALALPATVFPRGGLPCSLWVVKARLRWAKSQWRYCIRTGRRWCGQFC